MGVDIHILVPHNIADVSIDTVTTAFHPLGDLFRNISRQYSQLSVTWRDVSDPSYKCPRLFQAPAGFNFSFGPKVLTIYHITRFHSFCTEPDIRQLLREFTYQVLQIIYGNRAIYLPDQGLADKIYDLIFDGLSFEEVEAYLLRLGAPSASFIELDVRHAPQPQYYIDRFEDLTNSKS